MSKKSATLLMKELKAIETEIAQIHKNDEECSSVPVNEEYAPRYESDYSYEENRNKVAILQERERVIRSALNNFNNTVKVDGYDFTIAEGLVRIAQLKNEIKVVTALASKHKFQNDAYSRYGRSDEVRVVTFDIEKAKKDLKVLQNALSDLMVAVDKTNLNSSIDI